MGVTVSMGIGYHWIMSHDFIDICQQLETWYKRPAGRYLLDQEKALAEKLLEATRAKPQLFPLRSATGS